VTPEPQNDAAWQRNTQTVNGDTCDLVRPRRGIKPSAGWFHWPRRRRHPSEKGNDGGAGAEPESALNEQLEQTGKPASAGDSYRTASKSSTALDSCRGVGLSHTGGFSPVFPFVGWVVLPSSLRSGFAADVGEDDAGMWVEGSCAALSSPRRRGEFNPSVSRSEAEP
jgi:hypothetical protein